MGGYLAGSTDTGNGGFQFLPGDSGEYVSNGLPSWHAADEDIGDTLVSTLMR